MNGEKFTKEEQQLLLEECGITVNSPYEVDWFSVSINCILSETFMDTFANFLSWDDLFTHQAMTEEFVKKHHKRSSMFTLDY